MYVLNVSYMGVYEVVSTGYDFEIYTINSLMKTKKIETNFIMPKTLFWVLSITKTKRIKIISLGTSLKWPHSLSAHFFFSFFPTFF